MADNEGPIFDDSLPLAVFFIEIMEHADTLDNECKHHEAHRLRGLAQVCHQTFMLIHNELTLEVGQALEEHGEEAPIHGLVFGVMDAAEAINDWMEHKEQQEHEHGSN